ncbi:PTS lactose/cellobiose transporter subunit IIA, partial [Listeria monocytogenes]|nr:PTS lactose/cellobiose transporter subunit IIA [Listeria monocytogenes]ECR3487098.1 PTS lactose/cellobiose transporter subunit IIA [Listeria innocua]EAH2443801.1 PTS lactose/cellobiose transporter subunit IIA [Listeria monocytogenes]EAH3298890.1 PTS lactose/cellobiose transporter subunit IIA [Listeria monocytogenes]EAK8952841.1 PTS lactose/cellobiose transporter subunit IIA [Listeria monocytogenes]
ALLEAHHSQTSLIQGEARGEKAEVSLLLVHAQDHLMNAITFKDLAKEIVDLYRSK